jgi:ABC-2 type transport system ATP-binding protein
MTELIALDRLTKNFGPIEAVSGVSFTVQQGEVLGLLGPNGAGKSTTMKMLAGFLVPSSGTASVCGFDVQEQGIEAKRQLGYLPEGAPAYADMTPKGFLSFIAAIRGFSGAEATRRIGQAVERANLANVLEQPIDTLSKGFKRRVGLAQALLHDPRVLVLDEPTDGLDPNQKHEVRRLIAELKSDKAIIISTHLLEEVEAVCSRAVIIAHGKIVADGTPAELAAFDPQHKAVILVMPQSQIAAARAKLSSLTGVASVADWVGEEADGLAIRPVAGTEILTSIGTLVRSEGWDVSEIRLERGRLDQVFRDITQARVSTDA